jgi:hypothetical protein
MRTDAINWFASSELCRSLQDGGKTPLTSQRAREGFQELFASNEE